MALISHLLQQRGRNVLIAVVTLLPADTTALKALSGKAADRKHSRGQHGSQSDAKQRDDVDLGRLHTLGTAARVLQLTRSAQVRKTCGRSRALGDDITSQAGGSWAGSSQAVHATRL